MQALAPNFGTLEDLAELESFTNGRLRAQQRGLSDLRPEELVFGKAGDILINAAFTHTRPGGSRFNGDERGAWYCAFECETSIAEVGFHLTRALADVGRFENVTDYSELFADFIGPFHDVRGADPGEAFLNANPAVGYPAGQALAKALRASDGNGIVYPSVRRAEGTCLVAFHPTLVQNVRQGAIWRMEWQGTPEPMVTKFSR